MSQVGESVDADTRWSWDQLGILAGSAVLVVGFLGGLWFEGGSGTSTRYLIWLIGGAGIVMITLAFVRRVAGSMKLTNKRIKDVMEQAVKVAGTRQGATHSEEESDLKNIAVILERSLTPRLELCSGLDRVCRVAAETIELAHSEASEDNRYITFYGSASLSTTDPTRDRFGKRRGLEQKDEDIQTPEQIYAGALEAAASDQIRIRRYIRLFSELELRSRGEAIRREYIVWLRMQLYQLKRNPNFRLIDVVRAPEWGSNVARIVTHRRLLEIAGNGEGCLLLVGENLAEAIRRQSREAVLGDGDARNLPKHFGQGRPWRELPGTWARVDEFEHSVVSVAEKTYKELEKERDH